MTTPRSWSKVLGGHGMVQWGKYSQINHILLYFFISQKWRGFQKPHHNILLLVGTNHLRIVEIRIKSWLLHPAAPKLRRGFWKPHESLVHFVASKSWLIFLAKYIWRYIPDCDAVSGNPMIFCYAQPNIFGGSQIHSAIHPWMRRVLENQSHFLIPSQIYSAAAKYIWLYIPGCDGVRKINHISLCPAKTNWRTSGAPDQNKTLKDQEPSLKKAVVRQGLQEWDLGGDVCMSTWLGVSTSPIYVPDPYHPFAPEKRSIERRWARSSSWHMLLLDLVEGEIGAIFPNCHSSEGEGW